MTEVRESKMSAAERHHRILQMLEQTGFITVPEMAARCGVSEMTMRRDLDKLSEAGELERTHGGAMAPRSDRKINLDLVEPRFEYRAEIFADEKLAIARRAAREVTRGQTIALDVGSTCFTLAQQLSTLQIRLFTSSLKIAASLSEKRANVYVPPGQIYGSEPSIVGSHAVEHLGNFNFDIAFIGISGVTDTGFYDYSLEDANIKRALVGKSRRIVILADSSKFGRMSVALISDFKPVESIITNAPPPEWLAEICKTSGTRIIIANPLE